MERGDFVIGVTARIGPGLKHENPHAGLSKRCGNGSAAST
jgi:hypothetical protein